MGLKDFFKKEKTVKVDERPPMVFVYDLREEQSAYDYASITDKDILPELVQKSILQPLFLIDLRFGGSDKADNLVYVPPKALIEKLKLDDKLESYLSNGKKIGMNSSLEYKERSIIPSKITMIINGELNQTYEFLIW